MAIIGGGPAGLALGRDLAHRGIDSLILERGEPGEAWARMPSQMKLVSPWMCNYLVSSDSGIYPASAEITRADFARYLRDFAMAGNLSVVSNCEVLSVRMSGNTFLVNTTQGALRALIVVNATGYFTNPVYPEIPGQHLTRIVTRHFADYRDVETISALAGSNRHVIIAGSRLSAGQVALELHDAGFRVSISHRSPLKFGVDDWLWPVVRLAFPYGEAIRLRFGFGAKSRLHVPMQGGRLRKLIRRGNITTHPPITRFTEESVVFSNGIESKPGIVIYATGFAPALEHLRMLNLLMDSATGAPRTSNMESQNVPNLFFLGLDMLRTFQSRFLRGIRNDGVVLANLLQKRLAIAVSSSASLDQCVV